MKIYIDISGFINNFFRNKYLSGIQRVVKEVTQCFLRDNQNEIIFLDYSDVHGKYNVLDNEVLLQCYEENGKIRQDLWTGTCIEFESFAFGAVFFDIDNVWVGKVKRSFLYPILKQRGVKIVTLIHDIIPVTHPQYVQKSTVFNFLSYIGACLQYANLTITTTQATKNAIDVLCKKIAISPVANKIVPLGSDFKEEQEEDDTEFVSSQVENIVQGLGKYVLMVGTIEPRKNHKLLLDALENGLAEQGISVIFAGKYGWNVEDLKVRIRSHPLLNESLFFFERPNDKTIKFLYENALGVVFPTFNEGFGLPVVEALQLGTPVIVSDIEVMHEIAGEYADYFNNKDSRDLAKKILQLANNKQKYAEKKEKIKEFPVFTWKESAKLMKQTVLEMENRVKRIDDTVCLEQILLFSKDNESAMRAITEYEKYLPFVKKILICTSVEDISLLKNYSGHLKIDIIRIRGCIKNESISLQNIREVIGSKKIGTHFLLTTDSVFPISEITTTDFVSENKYKAYYCANLEKWVTQYKNEPFFDEKEESTLNFLYNHSLTTWMFESHQMQIINKNIVKEIIEKYLQKVEDEICFESVYFNYMLTYYSDMLETCTYVTMGWPVNCYDWDPEEIPKRFLFEDVSSEEKKGTILDKVVGYYANLQKQKNASILWRAYQEYYYSSKGELPSFVLYVDKGKIEIKKPTYIQLIADSHYKIPFSLDGDGINKLGITRVQISYWFTDKNHKRITEIIYESRTITEEVMYVLIGSPKTKENCVLNMNFSFGNNEQNKTITVAAYVSE